MFTTRPCGCKGIRTCFICEAQFHLKPHIDHPIQTKEEEVYEYCYHCDKAWIVTSTWYKHPHHQGRCIDFPGVLIMPHFITEAEESALVSGCDRIPWDLSQSGRRKQNFGPKTNFKKRKINGKTFNGFPAFTKFVQEKLRHHQLLTDFQTIEQCAIEYRVETGSCIDPHIDDCWVWGERVISLNLLSDSVLSMTKYTGPMDKYNLQYSEKQSDSGAIPIVDNVNYPTVRIPMPRLSLLVLFGPARYSWEHCIYRKDIQSRRICMAYREFTPEYLKDGKHYEAVGKPIFDRAQNFW